MLEAEIGRQRKPSFIALGTLLSVASLLYLGGLMGSPSTPAVTPTPQIVIELGDALEVIKRSTATLSPTWLPTKAESTTGAPEATKTVRSLPTSTREAANTSTDLKTSTAEATDTAAPLPTAIAQLLCSNPHVLLTYPTQSAMLKGTVKIRGSADIDNLWYYKFEFRAAGVKEWAFLESFDEPVTDGVLGYWNTATLPSGWYEFRLMVIDNTGNYPEPCEVRVLVVY